VFMPKQGVMWQSYFDPHASDNQAYVRSEHYKKIFPDDYI